MNKLEHFEGVFDILNLTYVDAGDSAYMKGEKKILVEMSMFNKTSSDFFPFTILDYNPDADAFDATYHFSLLDKQFSELCYIANEINAGFVCDVKAVAFDFPTEAQLFVNFRLYESGDYMEDFITVAKVANGLVRFIEKLI